MNFWLNKKENKTTLKEGKFIRFMKRYDWEYVERNNCTGIVIIIARTEDHKVILTEQYRIPVRKNVIEFPAGLVNDLNSKIREALPAAAKRELLEETGYQARRMVKITEGPVSGGFTSDIVTIFKAQGLKKVASGGGDPTETIVVHEVDINKIDSWLNQKRKKGCLVDPKIYAGLYFLKKYNG